MKPLPRITLKRLAMAALALVVITGAIAYVYGVQWAERAAKSWLSAHNIPATWTDTQLSWRGLSLKNVTLGEVVTAQSLTLSFAPAELLSVQRVERITIEGLELTLTRREASAQRAAGWSLGALDGLLESNTNAAANAPSTPLILPFSEISLLQPRVIAKDSEHALIDLKAEKIALTMDAATTTTATENTAPAARFSLFGLEGVAYGVPLKGGKITLNFTSLAPLETEAAQPFTLAEIATNPPLSECIGTVALRAKHIAIGNTECSVGGGGTLGVKPFTLPRNNPAIALNATLYAHAFPLHAALRLLVPQGMDATGLISGELPISWHKGALKLGAARFHTEAPGTLRYTPGADSPLTAGQNMQTDLLLDALKNFHYQHVIITHDAPTERLSRVTLALKGNNPTFYDGKPVELNVTLNGNLTEILLRSLDAYHLSDTLEKLLEKRR